MPTFDIVSEVDKQELKNAVDQTNKVGTPFRFQGLRCARRAGGICADHLRRRRIQAGPGARTSSTRLGKRSIDMRCLDKGKIEKVSGNKVKQTVTVKTGVETELAKKIVKLIKDSKIKVQASIQGEAVRVTGAKRDLLQETIALVKKSITDFPLQYQNFRD